MDLGVLNCEDLHKVYRMGEVDVRALDGVDFTLHAGELLVLIGASGSGKSTLLNLIAGLDRPTSGTVTVAGQRIDRLSETGMARCRRRRIGMIFQFFNLLDDLTVADNVLLPAQLAGMPRSKARARAGELLAALHIERHRDAYPGRLSGGERQRVAIARALVSRPDVLICDEVTSALDVSVQAAIVELLGELQKSLDLAMLFVTHNLPLVRSIAQRVAVMSAGRIVELGAVDSVLLAPSDDYTKRLLSDTPSLEAVQS